MSSEATPTPPPIQPPLINLRASEATLPKERTYFNFVLIFSILVWLALAITIVGIGYALAFALFAWIGNGLLVARLRSECVEVGEGQLPGLHRAFGEVCQQLGVRPTPRLYVLQSGGALNAFATRFSGRDFVVVYSDMLKALGEDSAEMRFILGHELGHVRSSHILKRVFLAPGLLLPLLGAAYLRACEASCDRHGVIASGSVQASARALLVLAGGPDKPLDAGSFARQHASERGFFISLHELSSGYPTLSQRTAKILALSDPTVQHEAPRTPFAYVFAFVTPNTGLGGGSSFLVLVVVIGLLAAMAIPAFQKVRQASQAKVCQNNIRMISAAYDQYELENGKAPQNYNDFIGPKKFLKIMPKCPSHGEYSITALDPSGCEISCSAHAAPAK
jgi:Zn-dependent protease with chaperone function/competence protein ComGC